MFLLVVSKGVVRRPEGAALREAQRRSEAEPPSLPSFHEKAGVKKAEAEKQSCKLASISGAALLRRRSLSAACGGFSLRAACGCRASTSCCAPHKKQAAMSAACS